jgi:hypothetical protein
MITICPCRNCKPPKRSITCHGTCEEYILWKKELNKFNHLRHEQQRCDAIADEDYHTVRRKRSRK